MRIASVGHAVFAATMIALGIAGLWYGNFAPIWDGVPKDFASGEALAYLCGFVSLVCGISLFWQRTASTAARVLFAYLLLWMLLFKLPYIVHAPTVEAYYQSCGETAVLVAGAWVLYAWFAAPWDQRRLGFATGEKGVRLARALYGLALIAFGLSHFAYLNLTAPLVPAWLPLHVAWAYFTGCAYLAAGAAVLIGVCPRLAAALSALQMGLLTLLVWVPLLAEGLVSAGQRGGFAVRSEFAVSWALTAAAWVVADSYRGMPWLAVGMRAGAGAAAERAP
ncbi:MAG: DoxX family membrane protein [Steroidobacteraceae bacterium]